MNNRFFVFIGALLFLVSGCNKESGIQAISDETISVVGVWGVKTGTDFSYLTLLSNNTFLYAENDTTVNNNDENGLEVGTYLYDSVNEEITFSVIYDDNAPGDDSGIGNIGTPVKLTARLMEEKSKLSLANGELILTKMDVVSPAVAGVWSFEDGAEFSYLTLLSNNTFLYAENDLSVSTTEENGLEVGTYVYNANTEEITFSIDYDDNAPGADSGIGNVGTANSISAVLSNGNKTLTLADIILTKAI